MRIDESATEALCARASDLERRGEHGVVAGLLGAQPTDAGASFGFWVPEPVDDLWLEVLLPPSGFRLGDRHTIEAEFERALLPMQRSSEHAWLVVADLEPGDRRRCGPLYRAVLRAGGEDRHLVDPMAFSSPFGAFGPSELLDPETYRRGRPDADYYRSLEADEPHRLGPFVNILQVHVPTATGQGTLAALTRRLDDLVDRIERGAALEPADELWLGYDSFQLMPVEPTIRREATTLPFEVVSEHDDILVARVRTPSSTNWGYDIVVGGSAAVNPALLESGRPHELSELAARLHTFPGGPIRLIIDVVFGHADNQALEVMPRSWFTGPDMYGQHLDYRNPRVRAQLLEMQRRKADHGVDGIRVDGAQDFTWWDETSQTLHHDDDYLMEMSAVVQEVEGVRYRPWMIFEDGRPWPRADWEIASTYRAVIEQQPHAFQWGPLTFAHNTPFLFTFWLSKWWRLRESADFGSNWITGCANHDTLRRGSQVDPDLRINTYLGDDLPAIIERSYDHPAAQLLFHAFLPGVPMDFLQANARAPWSFIRNTDHRYAIKVWAEESRFLDWRVSPDDYADPSAFPRMKGLGFVEHSRLREFMSVLAAAVAIHGEAVDPVVELAKLAPRPAGFEVSASNLIVASHAWMDDVHEFCKVDTHLGRLDRAQVRFARTVRALRLDNPWLCQDLGGGDRFQRVHPADGSAVFHGIRHGPRRKKLGFVANMEGAPCTVVPVELWGDDRSDWSTAISSPGLDGEARAERTVHLADGEGCVFIAD